VAGAVAATAAAAANPMLATEDPAVTLVVQPAAVRTGKREGATPDTDTAITVAEGCRITAAAAKVPATGTVAAAAEAVVPGATSAEVDTARVAARTATMPARAATATIWSAQLC
jgi:hypothetical protein